MGDEFQEKLKDLVLKLGEECDIDIFLVCGTLERPFGSIFIEKCRSEWKNHDKAMIILATYGGDPGVAYRIARHTQKIYKEFSIYIHTFCKSAGTLLALGSSEVIMSDFAEMGPLDIQLMKADEIGERSSGLIVNDALETLQSQAFKMFEDYLLDLRRKSRLQITTKSAMDAASSIAVGLYGPIYSQIDPMRLGENQRAVRITWEYGERIKTKNVKQNTLGNLIMGYPDHGFIIDSEEAKKLFVNVRAPSDSEFELAEHIRTFVDGTLENHDTEIFHLTHECLEYEEEQSKEDPDEQNECRPVEVDGGIQETESSEIDREGQEADPEINREGQETAAN